MIHFAWNIWCSRYHILTILALGWCWRFLLETSCYFGMLICKCQHAFSKGRCCARFSIRNLFGSTFDMQENFFKITMKSLTTNVMQLPFDGNSVTWLWHMILSSSMLCHNLLEHLKLAKIISILVFQSVENKKCFLIMIVEIQPS